MTTNTCVLALRPESAGRMAQPGRARGEAPNRTQPARRLRFHDSAAIEAR